MKCGCTIGVDFENGPSCIKEMNPVARKEHICGECSNTIMPGQKYVRILLFQNPAYPN